MNKTTSICVLVVFAGIMFASTLATPDLLSDGNLFLKDFVGSELLATLGVILAITLASSGQLHLAFNQIEERFRAHGLRRTRASVRSDTYALIVLFLIAVAVVVGKGMLPPSHKPWSESAFNGAALVILLWNTLLLVSLTRTIFAVPAVFDEHDEPATGGEASGTQSPQGTGGGKRR